MAQRESARGVEDGRVVVDVWDFALWDLLDDHFTEECSLEGEEKFLAKQDGEPNGFVFPTAVSLAEVIAALNRLDPVATTLRLTIFEEFSFGLCIPCYFSNAW